MFDPSEDFIVFDGLESLTLEKVRGEEGIAIDFTSGTYSTGRAEHEKEFVLDNCVVRLVSQRDQALVKQIFQRGVALASLNFQVADAVIEVYDEVKLELEDVLIREDGTRYTVVAMDFSHLTSRVRAACRVNK